MTALSPSGPPFCLRLAYFGSIEEIRKKAVGTTRGGGKIVIGCKGVAFDLVNQSFVVFIFVAFVINRIALACMQCI